MILLSSELYGFVLNPEYGSIQAVPGAVKCISYPIFLSLSITFKLLFNILNNVEPEPLWIVGYTTIYWVV